MTCSKYVLMHVSAWYFSMYSIWNCAIKIVPSSKITFKCDNFHLVAWWDIQRQFKCYYWWEKGYTGHSNSKIMSLLNIFTCFAQEQCTINKLAMGL